MVRSRPFDFDAYSAASAAWISPVESPACSGNPAIPHEMVARMADGSVIVDIAAERGGNCEATRAGETVEQGGVRILGPLNLPSTIPYHASQMYAKNIAAFLKYLVKDGKLSLNLEDEIVRETLVTHGGEYRRSSK